MGSLREDSGGLKKLPSRPSVEPLHSLSCKFQSPLFGSSDSIQCSANSVSSWVTVPKPRVTFIGTETGLMLQNSACTQVWQLPSLPLRSLKTQENESSHLPAFSSEARYSETACSSQRLPRLEKWSSPWKESLVKGSHRKKIFKKKTWYNKNKTSHPLNQRRH